jgi:tripartite-type tricarboxylate transporter receptor subunit TctC
MTRHPRTTSSTPAISTATHPSRRAIGACVLACAAVAVLHTREAAAQADWPRKPLTLVVPYSAGGSLDATTRLLAQHLADQLKQQVVVENVTGAGGSLGMSKVIQAAPDGYTFLVAGDAPLNPKPDAQGSFFKHDVLRELRPVALVNTAPMVLVAHPSVEANNLAEFVALARRHPGRFSYATSGIGTLPHLGTEMLEQAGKIHLVHIPYRGGAQIVNDVAGKQLELAMLIVASAVPSIRSGSVKALAVTSGKRSALLPDVPAAAETRGFEGFDVSSWAGVYAPAATPPAVVERMNRAVDDVLKLEAVRTRLAQAGAVPGGGAPGAFASFIREDRAKVQRVLKDVKLGD